MPKLMEVLEYVDPTGEVMVKRLPDSGEYEITYGSQLTVRESQVAIFFRDGRVLDVFTAGRHVLKTQNLPVLTKFITGLAYGKKESIFLMIDPKLKVILLRYKYSFSLNPVLQNNSLGLLLTLESRSMVLAY